jgi:hypothetical protein
MIKPRSAIIIGLVTGASLISVAPVNAEDRRVRIYNSTNYTMTEFRASNIDRDLYGYDRLGSNVLEPGDAIVLNISDGNGYCRFDLKATFENGVDVYRHNFNVCEEVAWGVDQRRNRRTGGYTLVAR